MKKCYDHTRGLELKPAKVKKIVLSKMMIKD